MAAYAALVSLMQIIDQIEHHPFPPISLDKQQVESLTEIVTFLQAFLEGYNSPLAYSNEADPLEMRIADAAYAAEDVIESNIVDRIHPAGSEDQRKKLGFWTCFPSLKKQPKNDVITNNRVDLYEGLQKVIEEMHLIKKEVMQIVVVQDQLQRQVSVSASSSKSSSAGLNNAVVGVEDVMLELLDKLTAGRRDRQAIPIVGMGGIGKTTLARSIYQHPLIKDHFDVCAWATISQQYNVREILRDLLSQANKESSARLSEKIEEDKVGDALHKYLFGRRFLIVLDDMWSVEAWENMQLYFPDNGNGSRIMVTTRLSNLGSQLDNDYSLTMKFLDEVSSWNMFSNIVFRGGICPLELEKIGKEIVKSCRGLPLSIVVMGGLLEKMERTEKRWESIRRSLNASVVNSEDDERCLKILKLSYNHLPVHLKPCFLYMGVFEEDRAIRVSTVVKLWVSEGFLKPISGKILETIAEEYLKELVDRNLILVHKMGSTGRIRFFKIHDLPRDLCLREAEKERFYHVVGKHNGCSQRRIVIPTKTSKKKVVDAIKSTPHARSYLSDREGVRLLPNLRFLRTLKAHDRYIYGGHKYSLRKLFEPVNLRFVSIKTHHRHRQLPSSINLLWSLQTLIVSHPRTEVVVCIGSPVAPVEIWRMPQLRHVHFRVGGLHLVDPPRDSIVVMENLQTLEGVTNFKCNEEMVRRIPNIKKLGVSYDLDKCHGDHYCIHNIERLQKLESLSCQNWRGGDGVFLQKLTFPHSLKSLSLEHPSKRMEDTLEKIGRLPLLQKLRLKFGTFETCKWETVEGQFPSLKLLSLGSCIHLEYWVMESSHLPCLEHLHLEWLRDLKEIPAEIGEIPTLQSIVLKYCSKEAVKSMKMIVEEQEALQGEELPFTVAVELWGENQELQSLANPNFQVTAFKLEPRAPLRPIYNRR